MNNVASVENYVIDLHNSWCFITSVRKPNLIIVKCYIKQKNNSAGLKKRGAAFRYLDVRKPPIRSQRIFFVLFMNYCQNIFETFTCIFRKRKNNSMTREMSRATNSARVAFIWSFLWGRFYLLDVARLDAIIGDRHRVSGNGSSLFVTYQMFRQKSIYLKNRSVRLNSWAGTQFNPAS